MRRLPCSGPLVPSRLLLLVEFTGRPPTRLACYGGLYVVGACFVVLGTAGLDAQGGCRRDDGDRRFRRALRRDRRAPSGHGDDGGLAHLRPARGGGAARLGDRPSPDRVDDCGCLLHCRLHVPVAAALARQSPAAACRGHFGRRPAGRRPLPRRRGPAGLRRRGRRAAPAPAAVLRHARIPRRAQRRARWRCPSWWAASNGSPATAP